MKLKTKVFTLSSILLLAGVLSACSPSSDKETATTANSTTSSNSTHTVTDTLGHKVEIPNAPKRIIGSYLEDYLIALGEKPIAQWTVGSGSIQDYLQDDLKDVPTISYDLPYEKVLSFEPDLLLISSSATVEGGKYEQYSKIAPTYVVKNGTDVTWEEQLKDVGKALAKEKEAEKIISDYQKSIKKTREELAFGVPDLVEEVSKKATSDWSAVSSEKLAELDADYIILVNSDKDAAMFNEPSWKNLKAVTDNHVLQFGPESSWLYNGPIASQEMVNDIKEKLN